MNMVGCLDVPDCGHILLDGHDISQLSESALAQIRGKKVGFVFQKFNLISNMTALENVMMPMTFQGVPYGERRRRAMALLEKLELGKRVKHKSNELSGGEQQRVAIARALSNNPEVILADEPTGNLDSVHGREVMDFLTKLNKEDGRTIIVVTHDKDVAAYAERTVRIFDGAIAPNKGEEPKDFAEGKRQALNKKQE
jgi:putative ABC transport system ATP-binding protein